MLITKIYLICVHTLCNDVVSPHCWWSKTSWICFHKHCNSMASLWHDLGSFCGMAIWISGHTPYNGKAFLLCGSFCVMSIWISGHTPYNGKAFLLCGSFYVPLQSQSVATHLTMEKKFRKKSRNLSQKKECTIGGVHYWGLLLHKKCWSP